MIKNKIKRFFAVAFAGVLALIGAAFALPMSQKITPKAETVSYGSDTNGAIKLLDTNFLPASTFEVSIGGAHYYFVFLVSVSETVVGERLAFGYINSQMKGASVYDVSSAQYFSVGDPLVGFSFSVTNILFPIYSEALIKPYFVHIAKTSSASSYEYEFNYYLPFGGKNAFFKITKNTSTSIFPAEYYYLSENSFGYSSYPGPVFPPSPVNVLPLHVVPLVLGYTEEQYKQYGDDRYENGTLAGYNTGYAEGVAAAGDYTFFSLISAVIDAPISAFSALFNFEILGVNMRTFVLSLLTAVILVAVVRFFMGRA